MRPAIDLRRFLTTHLGVVAPWDATPRTPETFPIARIRTTRSLRGSVHRVVPLTAYETQTILDDLARTGPGTTVEITLPTDAPESVQARTEHEFGRLRRIGVEVVIRQADAAEPAIAAATGASMSRAVAELAVVMGRLLHELQSERALTAAHLTAGDRTSTAHFEAQWRATDGVLGVWDALLVANADLVPPLVRMHADAVNSLVTQLGPTRRGVQERGREVAESVDYYTQLTHALLATVDGLVAAGDSAPTMTAHLAFLHAKEEAAVEQLEIASAAVRHGLSHSMAARVASRDAYLRTFATTAAEPVLSEYRALMGDPPCRETPGLEHALIERECPHVGADAEAWYRTMASLFERFRDVESRSAATLLASTA
jgi:hypothetical protein